MYLASHPYERLQHFECLCEGLATYQEFALLRHLLLSIYLPMPANADEGSAKWDAKKETLVVTLPIIRDEW